MGLKDDKKNVFTTIGAYTSMMQAGNMPDESNLFPSINNKKDVVPYLLDVLKVVVGTDALQQLTGELFTNLITKIEPNLKSGVKKQLIQSNAGDTMPDFNISVPVKDIDVFGKYKTNPASKQGSLIYGQATSGFDNVAYNAIKNGSSVFGGILSIEYDSALDELVFKPIGGSTSIGSYLESFVDEMTLIDKKAFMSDAMNLFYGSITASQNKTVEQAAQELQILKLIEQLINDNDSFEISPEDYDAILQKAQELINGIVYYDLGCGVMAANLSLDGMADLIANISGSTDPFQVSNRVYGTVAESTKDNPEVSAANKQTVKDGFFQKLIDLITQTLANAITTTPQIRTILAIYSSFQNGGIPQIGNPLDDLKKFKIFIKCNLNVAMAEINKFIYNIVITYLIALLWPVIQKVIREKINQYLGVIKSLAASKLTG